VSAMSKLTAERARLGDDEAAATEHVRIVKRWRARRMWRTARRGWLLFAIAELALFAATLLWCGLPAPFAIGVLVLACPFAWAALGAPFPRPCRLFAGGQSLSVDQDGWFTMRTRWSKRHVPISSLGALVPVVPDLESPYLTVKPAFSGPAGKTIVIGRGLGLTWVELARLVRRLESMLARHGWSHSTLRPARIPTLDVGATERPEFTFKLPPTEGLVGMVPRVLLPTAVGLLLAAFESAGTTTVAPYLSAAVLLTIFGHAALEDTRGSLRRVVVEGSTLTCHGRFRRLDIPLDDIDTFTLGVFHFEPEKPDELSFVRTRKRSILRPLSTLRDRAWRLVVWVRGLPVEIRLDRGHREETARALVDGLNRTLATLRGSVSGPTEVSAG
jgi:hypothetical protein